MHVVSAALAFAVIMLVLSMVVSALVETIHRLLGMRERGLYQLLGQFYDQVLKPYASAPATSPAAVPAQAEDAARAAFQDRMSENRTPVGIVALGGPARTSLPAMSAGLGNWVRVNWRGRGLSSLSCVGFMERLGSHPLSDAIVDRAQVAPEAGAAAAAAPDADPLNATLQDFAQKFEFYSNEATVSFERRARTLSITVAVVVAFLLHVDAVEIFRTFLRDPALAAAVIAKQDEVMKTFDADRKEREKQIPAVAANAAQWRDLQQAMKDIEGVKRNYDAMVAKLKGAESELAGLGVPVGWTDERWISLLGKPHCESEGKPPRREVSKDTACAPGETRRDRGFGFGVLFGLLLGGLLVGLGGPFWYDMVNSLTSIRNVVPGQTTPGQTSPAPAAGASAGAGGAKETPQPRTPVDAFKAARAGWIAAGRPTR